MNDGSAYLEGIESGLHGAQDDLGEEGPTFTELRSSVTSQLIGSCPPGEEIEGTP